MFKCNYKELSLSFNEFHGTEDRDLPEYGEFCLLELKDGTCTGGKWSPNGAGTGGKFVRGTADTVPLEEVSRWHSLDRYDLSNCLEDEEVDYINLGAETEDADSIILRDFKSFRDKDFPKSEQYCLLLMMNGDLSAGRWDQWPGEKKGTFIYAPALACHGMDEVWAWTALGSDEIFAQEMEWENEQKREEELNRNPSTDPDRFKYGTDIRVYYEKALEKLRKEYPWATLAQMKKKKPWEIVPLHGQYVFGQDCESWGKSKNIEEWKDGNTADEFIDFLCEYTKEAVKNSNPEEKFKFGLDIEVYLDKAYENVKKDYRWLEKGMLESRCQYAIRQVDGDWEFVEKYQNNREYFVCDCGSAERFIEIAEYNYQRAALEANPVIDEYAVPFERVEIHGWYLERYIVYKLQTGDYKVSVQAGDRVTGAGREFFITPYCFEADTYEEFLNRYLEIVPGESFGLCREDLLPNTELKRFLGY